ncbi:hypothetical protein [Hymenobacter fodinae]|uniref:Uncharacterized protein n=1 Tax=Hymenobacter fodinae TaxID=2510796 RepID=A0A4Z0P721_9BACT|nr:hypothetical protein [Hymenobacter fodinae]TGE07738.1 hypothetical protein EU556_08265 [Hymenobacter fodinae]
MAFTKEQEALQTAHFNHQKAIGALQGAETLHHALMATGVLAGTVYDLSRKTIQELHDAREKAMVELQVAKACAYQPKDKTPLSEGYQFQRAFGEPATAQPTA